MKLKVRGSGKTVTLSKSNFLASGGEGDVYVRGKTAYKIYHNPSQMIPDGKINELQKIKATDVIVPLDILVNNKDKPVGYPMRYVSDTRTMCQFFTKAFKKRNNIDENDLLSMIGRLRWLLTTVHSANILVVDFNEMNILVDAVYHPVLIDCDSFQTQHYPATALMESIRDHNIKHNQWTQESDWFSWACVTFNVLTGIHPYKGKHPKIKGMTDRMEAGISVFNENVSVPKMVPPLDIIPSALRQWYKSVLEDGNRSMPPSDFSLSGYVVSVIPIADSRSIHATELFEFPEDITAHQNIHGTSVVQTGHHVYLRLGQSKYYPKHNTCGTPCYTAIGLDGIVVTLDPQSSSFMYLIKLDSGKTSMIQAASEQIMSYNGEIYAKSGDTITRLKIVKTSSDSIIASPQIVASVMARATTLYEGCAVQNMLGSTYISFFPEPDKHICLPFPELDGQKVVDAKFDTRVIMVVTSKNGQYHRYTFRLYRDMQSYSTWKDEDITYSGINFVVLDTGVCAHINESEELVLFSASPTQNQVKKIDDPAITGDIHLYKESGAVLAAKGNKLYRLTMK